MVYRCKFFKDKSKAEEYAEAVKGEVFNKDGYGYFIAQHIVEYGEDYTELFEYVVLWKE